MAVGNVLNLEVEQWPIIQPKRARQKDGYNCGVFICVVREYSSYSNVNIIYSACIKQLVLGIQETLVF